MFHLPGDKCEFGGRAMHRRVEQRDEAYGLRERGLPDLKSTPRARCLQRNESSHMSANLSVYLCTHRAFGDPQVEIGLEPEP